MRVSSKLPVAFSTSSSVIVLSPSSPLPLSSSLAKRSTSVDLAADSRLPLSSSAATLALSSCHLDHARHVATAATASSSTVPTIIAATTPALALRSLRPPPPPPSTACGAHRAAWMPQSKGLPSKSARENVENCPPTGTSPERLLYATSKWERKLSRASDGGMAPESALCDTSSDSTLDMPDSSGGIGPDSAAPAMALPSSESSTSDRHCPNPTGKSPEKPFIESRSVRNPGDAPHRAAASTWPAKLFPETSYDVSLPAPASTGWLPLNALYETLNSRIAGRSTTAAAATAPSSALTLTSSTWSARSRRSPAGSAPRSALLDRFNTRSAARPASDSATTPRSVALGRTTPTTSPASSHATPRHAQQSPPSDVDDDDALPTPAGHPSTPPSRPAEKPRSAARSPELHR
ncbi:Os02g0116750, partial [Oryza sativa Japonica Group]